MKIAIIGSRSFNDEVEFNNALAKLLLDIETPLTVISGGATGTDALATKFAHKNGYPLIEYKPDWKKYGRGAGLVRNTQIITESDMVIAFWDGVSKGTMDSINKAKKMNKKVHIIHINCRTLGYYWKKKTSIDSLMTKLDKITADPDTKILARKVINIENWQAAYEKWRWDGIVGESLIFQSSDISDLSEEELIGLLRKNELMEEITPYTTKLTENGLLFVSFNFFYDI